MFKVSLLEREAPFLDRSCSLGNVQKHVTLHYVVRDVTICRPREVFPNVTIFVFVPRDCKIDLLM